MNYIRLIPIRLVLGIALLGTVVVATGVIAPLRLQLRSANNFPNGPPTSREADSVRIQLKETKGFHHVFDVTNIVSGARFNIALEDGKKPSRQIQRIKQFEIVNNRRAIVAGVYELTGHDLMSVLDFDRRAVVDQFTGYFFSLSPDRRFIAYHKYATRAMSLRMSSQYLVYDLTAPPSENRPSGQVIADDNFNVGIPVFPPNARNVPMDNVDVPDDEKHSGSEFFWLGTTNILAFTDRKQNQDPQLVVVDLRRGLKNRQTFTSILGRALLSGSPCAEDVSKAPSGYYVTSIGVSGRGANFVRVEMAFGAATECGSFDIQIPGLSIPR